MHNLKADDTFSDESIKITDSVDSVSIGSDRISDPDFEMS